jgi:hypothetical protein
MFNIVCYSAILAVAWVVQQVPPFGQRAPKGVGVAKNAPKLIAITIGYDPSSTSRGSLPASKGGGCWTCLNERYQVKGVLG